MRWQQTNSQTSRTRRAHLRTHQYGSTATALAWLAHKPNHQQAAGQVRLLPCFDASNDNFLDKYWSDKIWENRKKVLGNMYRVISRYTGGVFFFFFAPLMNGLPKFFFFLHLLFLLAGLLTIFPFPSAWGILCKHTLLRRVWTAGGTDIRFLFSFIFFSARR